MRIYNKYLIKNTDQFDPEYFLSVNTEVARIKEKTENFPSPFKAEIIVSFLKDHALQDEWMKANPDLTELVTSGLLFDGSIESLFDSCRENPVFRQHLEIYLAKSFSEKTLLA
jgi:hypothetical protein